MKKRIAVLVAVLTLLCLPTATVRALNEITPDILENRNWTPVGIWTFSGASGTDMLILVNSGGVNSPNIAFTPTGSANDVRMRANSLGDLIILDDGSGVQFSFIVNGAAGNGDFTVNDGDINLLLAGALVDGVNLDNAVLGPASSTDNALARFNSTTGKLIQDYNSGAPTASDTGAVTLNNGLTVAAGDADVSAGDVSVPSGNKIQIEGAAGDTYTILDDDTNEVRVFVDGTRATQTRADQWIPPPCPADLATVSFGGVCVEVSTGKIRYRGILEAIP